MAGGHGIRPPVRSPARCALPLQVDRATRGPRVACMQLVLHMCAPQTGLPSRLPRLPYPLPLLRQMARYGRAIGPTADAIIGRG